MTTKITEKDDKIAKQQELVNKLRDAKSDIYGKLVDGQEKHGSWDHYRDADPSGYKKLKDEQSKAIADWEKAQDKLEKMKKSASKKNEGVTMKPAQELKAIIESLDMNGEMEELPVDQPVEVEIEDVTDMDEEDEDDMEDDELDESEEDEDEEEELTEEELDKEIEEGLEAVTEEEAEAEKEDDEDEEEEVSEAKSDFPQAAQIRKLKAMKRKESAKRAAVQERILDKKRGRANAKSHKEKLAKTKEVKKFEAEKAKHSAVIGRIQKQIDNLEAKRKEHKKKKSAAKAKEPKMTAGQKKARNELIDRDAKKDAAKGIVHKKS